MWVMLALFYIETSEVPIDMKVYDAIIFESETQCFDAMMHNREGLVKSLSELEISNRYSVKCVDANKYMEVKQALRAQQS